MGNVEAVILAAGLSSRMGSHKLLLPFQNKTIIEKMVEIIFSGGLEKVNVVVGFGKEDLSEQLEHYSVRIIENPLYRQGMSTSLRLAVEHVAKDRQTGAILVFNGDMPLIRPDTIKRLLEQYVETRSPIMAPVYGKRRGHPVLFGREMFDELLNITGDLGAKEVVKRNARLMRTVTVDDPGILLDIDTVEEYCQALARAEMPAGGKISTGGGKQRDVMW